MFIGQVSFVVFPHKGADSRGKTRSVAILADSAAIFIDKPAKILEIYSGPYAAISSSSAIHSIAMLTTESADSAVETDSQSDTNETGSQLEDGQTDPQLTAASRVMFDRKLAIHSKSLRNGDRRLLQTQQVVRRIAAMRIRAHRDTPYDKVKALLDLLYQLGMGQHTVERMSPLGEVIRLKADPDLKAMIAYLEFAIGRLGTVAEAAAVLASGGGEAPAGVAPTSSQTFVFNNFGASPASEPPETIKTIASKARRTPTPEALEEAQAAADAIKRRQEAISAAMNARRQPKPDEPQW